MMTKEERELKEELMAVLREERDDVYEFRQQIRKISESVAHKHKRLSNPVITGVAATMLLLLGLTFTLIYFSDKHPKTDVLYTKYFEPYSVSLATRGGTNVSDVTKALEAYSRQDFYSAINIAAANSETAPEVSHFVSGLCYLQMGFVDNAIRSFNKAEAKSAYYRDHILWYKSLSYLRKNDVDVASVILKKLCRDESVYNVKATNLLRELGN